MKLKIIVFLVGIISVFIGISSIKAKTCNDYTTEEFNYILQNTDPVDLDLSCSNGTPYTSQYLIGMESELASLELLAKQKQPNVLRYFTKELSVPNYTQSYGYYCGPANVKQVVQFKKNISKTQAQYANLMGTTKASGTIVYKMRNTLNSEISSGYYSYILGSSMTNSSFQTAVEERMAANKPIILHANTKTLAIYNGKSLGHYITVVGHTISGSYPFSIFALDTNSNNYGNGNVLGKHLDTLTNVFGTVKISGRYIIY